MDSRRQTEKKADKKIIKIIKLKKNKNNILDR
jgi:hypothetical protein